MYVCKYCGKEFKDKGNLHKHEKYTHEESAYQHTCAHCGKLFTASGIATHVDRCKLNPDRVPTEYELAIEKQKLEYQKDGNCKFCGKYCLNQNSLHNHELRCKLNPDRAISSYTPRNCGFKKGSIPWNKGLTKATDDRVRQLGEATRLGMNKAKAADPTKFTGRAKTEENELLRRLRISEGIRQSRTCGGKRHGSGRGKKGWYKGFFCDSTYELVYVIFNIDNNIEFTRCNRVYEYTYNNKLHKYYPDFELPDGSIVELKGYKTAQVEAKTASVTDRPIVVLYEQDLQYAFDWVKEHYSYTDLSDLYE